MASFSYNVFEWLWRKLGLLSRCFTAMLRPIVGYAFFAINWSKNPGRLQAESEGKPPVKNSEGQSEALAGGRGEETAGWVREAASELSGYEERAEHDAFGKETCQVELWREDDDDDDEFDSRKWQVETTDEFYCGYDSTWETEESASKRARRPAASRHYKFNRFENAARDMQNYRHGYPSQTRPPHWIKPVSDEKPNLNFYLGQRASVPDGVYIHDFHNYWAGNYDALERVHTYIQWLFPLQEPGMNYEASPLTKEEIKCFIESSTAKENLLKSYKLMLDFYGIRLCDEETGEVERAVHWHDRFKNLNTKTHNNLRITRILKCLGTLGYPHYQAPLVRFFLRETLINGQLPNVKDSVLNYFVFAVLNKKQRRSLIKFAYCNYAREDEFVWCPLEIQMMWSGLWHVQTTNGNEQSF